LTAVKSGVKIFTVDH